MHSRFASPVLRGVGWIIIIALFVARTAMAQCPGDCTGDGVVSINELIRAVNIALGHAPLTGCPAADANGDGVVRIGELISAVNAALTGCPAPPSATPTATETATPTVVNEAPVIEPLFVYRSHPGFAIEYAIPAFDPEGESVRCEAPALPPGASIDPDDGIFYWTPTKAQVGGYNIPIHCSDPAGAVTVGSLPVRITPLDTCSEPVCDMATGCTFPLVPLDEDCCIAEPAVRVREPTAQCMPGLVLHAGRNERDFGRMQNCDRLRISPSGQGSTDIRFNIETRCVDSSPAPRLAIRMEAADRVLYDQQMFLNQLVEREDGFSWQRAIFVRFELIDPELVDGLEVQLTLRLSDNRNQVVLAEHSLRLVLTTSALGDLPDVDREDIPADEAGCVGCHRPSTSDGVRFGIEEAHPWAELSCTDCHGGDATAFTRTAAHVPPSGSSVSLKALAIDELDAVSPDYLRFVNPGDLRVAPQTCGEAGCHGEIVAAVSKSAMATNASIYTVPRYLADMQGPESIYAALDIIDSDFHEATAPPYAIGELMALRGATAERWEMPGVIDEYLPKACPTCHLHTFGRNDAPGLYRSSGCTGCHMVYADDGRSRTADPMINKSFPSHPVKHTLTTALPVEQCAHCHHQGGRIGLAYRGIREGGFPPQVPPRLGQTLGVALYGKDRDHYFVDEDILNDIDETPPDVHFTAGLVCVDCHVGADVHGDGHMYSFGADHVGVRCEDCHGTIRQAIAAGADGVFRNAAGDSFRRLRRDDDGGVWLRLAMEDREVAVTQIAERVADNPRMAEAMGIDSSGFSHTDALECHACHSAWRQTCFGCHVGVDDRASARNWTTGETTRGAITERRDAFSLDFFALGVNARGKLTPLAHAMSTFFSYIDEEGVRILEDEPRRFGDDRVAFGWSPFFHHTVSRIPQNCDRCHAVGDAATASNAATLRETYGFGNGQVMLSDGHGETYDATAFLDESGALVGVFPQPETGPVSAAVRERAVAIVVTPQPR